MSGPADTAKQQASRLGDEAQAQAKQQASRLGDQAQEQAKQQLDTRSDQAADQVGSVSSAMRSAGGEMRSQGNDLGAQVVETVAQKADELAGYLRRSDGDQLMRDIQDFGRRQPLAVALAGLAAGVAAARFVKASSPRPSAGERPGPIQSASAETVTPGEEIAPAYAGSALR